MTSQDQNIGVHIGFQLNIVTPEQLVFSDIVDYLAVPGVDGDLGILPHHSPLITLLKPGILRIRKGSEEVSMAVSGGFLEVNPGRVTILADITERDEKVKFPCQASSVSFPCPRLPLYS